MQVHGLPIGEHAVPDPQCGDLAPPQRAGQLHLAEQVGIAAQAGLEERPLAVLEEAHLLIVAPPRHRGGLARVVRAQLHPQLAVLHDREQQAVPVAPGLGRAERELFASPVGDQVGVDAVERTSAEGRFDVQFVDPLLVLPTRDRLRAQLVDGLVAAPGEVSRRDLAERRTGRWRGLFGKVTAALDPWPAGERIAGPVLTGGAYVFHEATGETLVGEGLRAPHRTRRGATAAHHEPDLIADAAVGADSLAEARHLLFLQGSQ